MTDKQRFLDICKNEMKREGLDKLLDWLEKSDFFEAPASTKYHGNYAGGLLEHSLNVYDCLVSYLKSDRAKQFGFEYSDESIAIAALLHDLCKMNTYKVSFRNAKNELSPYTADTIIGNARSTAENVIIFPIKLNTNLRFITILCLML